MGTDAESDFAKMAISLLANFEAARRTVALSARPHEIGVVASVSNTIARVRGLPSVQAEEIVDFASGLSGMVMQIDPHEIGVVLLGDYAGLRAGTEASRSGRVMDLPVGEGLLGRVVSPLGEPLDGMGPIYCEARHQIERPAPPIIARLPVSVPLQTGIKVIDATVPIGRGQRELIVGDRQTGKTAIALDTIINQRTSGVLCIYCVIGQRGSAVAKTVATLRAHGAMGHTVVVVSEAHEAPGLLFVAPYAATSMAEHFMKNGRDVLVVYDDLSHHAKAWREVSLLLRRPPGREALPGDIFYIHSRLLERATRLRPEYGGGSLTALPIVETEAQNIAAFIPTNLISITDGQIYLSPTLFQHGILPAVDVGRSVSRVGGRAQLAAYRGVAGALKLSYAQFEELENFSKFGTRLEEKTRRTIEHGRRIRSCLKQMELRPVAVFDQIVVLLALVDGLFDAVALDAMSDAEASLQDVSVTVPPEIVRSITSGEPLSSEVRAAILAAAESRLRRFRAVS